MNKPPWLAAVSAEVDDEAYLEAGDFQVVEDVIVVSGAILFIHLEFHNDLVIHQDVWQIAGNRVAFVANLNAAVASGRDLPEVEFLEKRLFIHILGEPKANDLVNLQGCTDDFVGQVFEEE